MRVLSVITASGYRLTVCVLASIGHACGTRPRVPLDTSSRVSSD